MRNMCKGNNVQVGDKIRLTEYIFNCATGTSDFIVEEFRFCLGIFRSEEHRKADKFTPLCELYGIGPETENDYISNFGEYYTNTVPIWMDLPRD